MCKKKTVPKAVFWGVLSKATQHSASKPGLVCLQGVPVSLERGLLRNDAMCSLGKLCSQRWSLWVLWLSSIGLSAGVPFPTAVVLELPFGLWGLQPGRLEPNPPPPGRGTSLQLKVGASVWGGIHRYLAKKLFWVETLEEAWRQSLKVWHGPSPVLGTPPGSSSTPQVSPHPELQQLIGRTRQPTMQKNIEVPPPSYCFVPCTEPVSINREPWKTHSVHSGTFFLKCPHFQ